MSKIIKIFCILYIILYNIKYIVRNKGCVRLENYIYSSNCWKYNGNVSPENHEEHVKGHNRKQKLYSKTN